MKIERCAAYIRVSTTEQKLHGLSLDAQRDKLREYAEKNHLKIVEWYEDEGVSGRKLIKNRPELQRMINDAKKKEFDRIIFIKLDRFFRSIAEYHECMKLIDPVIWTATEEKYDLSTANGRAFVNMKLTIAELEADQTGERIKLVNEYKVKTGQPLSGSMPIGYMTKQTENGKRIVRNPEKEEMVIDLLNHIMTYQSKGAVTKYINQKYGLRLSRSQITRLLNNTLLYGEYRGNPNYIAEEECYLTKAEFEKMQSCLERRIKNNQKRHYIFTGLIRCPQCGRILSGTRLHQKKPSGACYDYQVYRCRGNTIDCYCHFNKLLYESTVERMMLEQIEQFFENEKVVNAEVIEAHNVINHDAELKELQAELDRLTYAWLKGRIKDIEKYDSEYDRLTEEIDALKTKKVEVEKKDFSNVEAALSENWRDLYNTLDNINKRAFWRSFVESIEIEWTTDVKRITKVNFY